MDVASAALPKLLIYLDDVLIETSVAGLRSTSARKFACRIGGAADYRYTLSDLLVSPRRRSVAGKFGWFGEPGKLRCSTNRALQAFSVSFQLQIGGLNDIRAVLALQRPNREVSASHVLEV